MNAIIAQLGWALYVSEGWHDTWVRWLHGLPVSAGFAQKSRAHAVVSYDRVLNGDYGDATDPATGEIREQGCHN